MRENSIEANITDMMANVPLLSPLVEVKTGLVNMLATVSPIKELEFPERELAFTTVQGSSPVYRFYFNWKMPEVSATFNIEPVDNQGIIRIGTKDIERKSTGGDDNVNFKVTALKTGRCKCNIVADRNLPDMVPEAFKRIDSQSFTVTVKARRVIRRPREYDDRRLRAVN